MMSHVTTVADITHARGALRKESRAKFAQSADSAVAPTIAPFSVPPPASGFAGAAVVRR